MADSFKLNPFTGKLDLTAGQDVATSATPTFAGETLTGPLTVTNAAVPGTPGTASQIDTGDPNTKGLVVKAHTSPSASKTPDQVSNLFAWYKADTLSLTDGSYVSSWADLSGNSHTLAQVANAPVFYDRVQNGLPAVRFFNNNDELRTATLTLNQPVTVFAVCRVTNYVNSGYVVSSNDLNAGTYVAGTTGFYSLYDGNPVQEATPSGTSFLVTTSVHNTTSSALYVNGTLRASGNAGAGNFNGVQLAAANPLGLVGDISEVVVYTGVLSTADRQGVEAYLGIKWGIGVSGQTVQASNLQEWQSAGGSVLTAIDATGRVVLPIVSGAPTGTPPLGTMEYDPTAHKIWVYDAGWKSVTLA